MRTIILHSQNLKICKQIATTFKCEIECRKSHIRMHTKAKINLSSLRQKHKLDFNYLPNSFDFCKTALFVSDLDSTLINIECIDEIADFANIKQQVTTITKQSIQGRLHFGDSLIKRTTLLKGIDANVLDEVYTKRLQINYGVKELITFLKAKLIKTAVVSGGFDYFTKLIAKDLGLDHSLANVLNIKNNKLTGTINGSIIDTEAKAGFINKLCAQYLINLSNVIAVGDGANDLAMLKIAGLSVAYKPQPIIANNADIIINFSGLDKIIDLFN